MISSTLNSLVKSVEDGVETVEEHIEDAGEQAEESLEALKNSISSAVVRQESVRDNSILAHPWFQVSVISMTLLNTLQMGLEADYPEWEDTWNICENVFTAGFALEMVIKLIVLKRQYFADKANWLDGSLTVLGILDCWILSLLGGETELQSLTILRILRLMRLARILKLAGNFKPCVLVIQGLMRAIQTTLYVFVLLLLILYVFAIFLTGQLGKGDTSMYPGYSVIEEVIDDQELMQNYNPYICFGSMSSSMLTLFNMAMMAEWQEIIRPIALKQPIYLVVFLLFALLVVFGVMNVMIGSIVDSVFVESKAIDQALAVAQLSQKVSTLAEIEKILIEMDTNGDGTLDYVELTRAMRTHPGLVRLMKDINLPSGWSGRELLDMLDSSGDGKLQRAEFTTSFFRLLESDSFQQICIMQTGINNVKHIILDSNARIQDRLFTLESNLLSMKTASCETTQSHENSATGDNPTWKPSQHQSQIERDKLADAPEITNDDMARSIDCLCNELREQIKNVSGKTSEEIHRAVQESFQKQFALIQHSLEIAGMPSRSGESNPDAGPVRELQCSIPPDEFGESMRQSDEFINQCQGPMLQSPCTAAIDVVDKCIHQSAEYMNAWEANPAEHPRDLSHELEFDFAENVQLGCEIHWVRDAPPIIGSVVPEGAASIRGIHAGDRLSECNGVSIDGMDRANVLQLLRLRPLRLTVFRGDV